MWTYTRLHAKACPSCTSVSASMYNVCAYTEQCLLQLKTLLVDFRIGVIVLQMYNSSVPQLKTFIYIRTEMASYLWFRTNCDDILWFSCTIMCLLYRQTHSFHCYLCLWSIAHMHIVAGPSNRKQTYNLNWPYRYWVRIISMHRWCRGLSCISSLPALKHLYI